VMRMLWQWDWVGAQADFEKARALDPGDNAVHQDYAMLLAYRGKVPEAIAETQNALQFEPLSVELLLNLGNYQTAMDDRTGAEASYRRGLDIEPGEQDLVSALAALFLSREGPRSRWRCAPSCRRTKFPDCFVWLELSTPWVTPSNRNAPSMRQSPRVRYRMLPTSPRSTLGAGKKTRHSSG